MLATAEFPTHVSEWLPTMSILFSFLYMSSTILHCGENQEFSQQLDLINFQKDCLSFLNQHSYWTVDPNCPLFFFIDLDVSLGFHSFVLWFGSLFLYIY